MIEDIVGGLLEGLLSPLFEAAGEVLSELFGGLVEMLFEGAADSLTAQQSKLREPTGGDWGGGPVERYKFLPRD